MEMSTSYHTAGQISDQLKGQIIGDPALEIKGLSAIESDEANTITFYGHPRYEQHIYGSQARAVLVPTGFDPQITTHITFIKVSNVYEAVSQLSSIFTNIQDPKISGVSLNCTIDAGAELGTDVSVGHYSVIDSGARIGARAVIHDHVYIGKNVIVGEDTIIHSGVKIMPGVSIGSRCILYPNAVIGTEGFGHALSKEGYKKIAHQGSVIIEDNVEIGSNSCVDRGAMRDTIIRKGAKLDNLIQVAHGVEIGENVAIAAQSGISGSSTIGKGSQLGGQVGIAGHVKVAPGSKIQAKSGVAANIEEANKKWYGYPILSYYNYLRSYALFKQLPDLEERIKKLEKNQPGE